MEDIKGSFIDEFVKVANDFCCLLEDCSQKRTGELFNELQQLLPEIYRRAAQLPKPKYCYDEDITSFVKEDDYARIHDSLQNKFELFSGITGMSPGTRQDKQGLVSFTMAESITDVYEELKNFLKLYEVGLPQAINDSIWFCNKHFEHSFGIRIIDSLKLLHEFIYNKISTGSRAIISDDFTRNGEEETWFSDDQEQVYGDDE